MPAHRRSPRSSRAASSPLISVPACPACGSTVRTIIDHQFEETRYSQHLRTLKAPVDALKLIRCGECQSVYRDPWFAAAAMAPVYFGAYHNHNAGMEVLKRPSQCALEERGRTGGPSYLYKFLRKYVHPLDRYGEFGCPIWGLLPYFEKDRYGLFGSIELTADARIFGVMVDTIANHQHLLIRLLRMPLLLRRIPTPTQFFFLEHGLPSFWGKACMVNMVPCALLPRLKNLTHILPDATPPGGPLDLLSMIDFLDHAHDAAAFLAPLAKKTRFLFIWAHGNTPHNWNAKHIISYSPEGLKKLALRCGFQHVVDYPVVEAHGEFGMLFRSTTC